MNNKSFQISKQNGEGYNDPTAYAALRNIKHNEKDIDKYNNQFIDAQQYVFERVYILRNDFLIYPTDDELSRLKHMSIKKDIDKYIRKLIKKHWDEDLKKGDAK